MRSLFVFDSSFLPDNPLAFDGEVDVFPLSGDFDLVGRVTGAIESPPGCPPQLLDSATAINEEVELLKTKIARWSADVGKAGFWGRAIKSWFLLPGEGVSSWWFSLISEKNTFKTDAFFNLARVAAITRLLKTGRYRKLVIALGDSVLDRSVQLAASGVGLESVSIGTRPQYVSRKDYVRSMLGKLGLIGDTLAAIFIFLRFVAQSFRARRSLGGLYRRWPLKDSVLMVAYYPGVDPKAAEQGIFKSKYYPSLQDQMDTWGLKKVWLLLYLNMAGEPFNRSLDVVRRFNNHGERVFLLTEFLGVKEFIKCLAYWCRQAALAPLLYVQVRNVLAQTTAGAAGLPLLKRLWFQSFVGGTGMEGICFQQAFTAAFQSLPDMKDVIYCMEMHAWEKGLIAAARHRTPTPRTIGFQHVAISTNYFHFLYDSSETADEQRSAQMPLPDVMALSGQATAELLAESHFPNVVLVESLRYLYVNNLIAQDRPENDNSPVLLVAGSISKTETRTLTHMVCAAFPKPDNLRVWFKGHPACPFEDIFKEMAIDPAKFGYEIKGGNIADALASARAVFVPTSTVSIEALVFGCQVLIPMVSDSMLMNPLADFPDFYKAITSPEDLTEAVREFSTPEDSRELDKKRAFVKTYWLTDPNLPRWKTLLVGED